MAATVIAVIGAGEGAAQDVCATAEEIGRRLAEAGATVVCGGLGGVMAAAARGAQSAGGMAVGILPGTDRTAGNEHLTLAIATGLGEARNTVVVRTADAVIAVGGGYGTLSEIGFALKIGRPVIGVGTWEIVREGAVDGGIRLADHPDEAVRAALAATWE